MARIETKINGISTTSDYSEGDCFALVNLRPKNGALHPVAPRKIMQEIKERYDIIFVHNSSEYKNWVGVKNTDGKGEITTKILDENEGERQTFNVDETILSIEQIGNTLSVITIDNIYYMLYRDNQYEFLGQLPDLSPIHFVGGEETTKKKFYNSFVSEGSVTKENFNEITKAALYMARQELLDEISPVFFDCFFVRYAFRLYDGTLTKHSPPILVMPRSKITEMMWVHYRFKDGHINGLEGTNPSVSVTGFTVRMWYNFTNLKEWKDIIQSVDIYISPYMGIANPENIGSHFKTTDDERWYTDYVIEKVTAGNLTSIKQNSSFYFVKSIEIGTRVNDFRNVIFPEENADTKLMENIVQRDEMKDDSFSHHKYGANISYTYNNRLHIGDIKTTFFNGYNPSFFEWESDYNGTAKPTDTVNSLIAEVEIQTDTVTGKVYSILTKRMLGCLFASSFISYPDSRAKSVTIYSRFVLEWRKVRTIVLKPHDFMNLAYYLEDDLKPIMEGNNATVVDEPRISTRVSIRESNKIKVSELNNPMNFPNKNTYLVSNGTIMAMATNLMKVAQWNYGQYPLYVFTSEGIWNLNVGDGQVVYSTLSSPTYGEAPTTKIVAATPFGVVFTTQRGLRIINGETVSFITPQLEQPPIGIRMEIAPVTKNVLSPLSDIPFTDYINDLDNLIYNPYTDELIINARDYPYNYVMNLNSFTVFQSTEKVDLVVRNLYEELKVVGNGLLKDYAAWENIQTHVSMVTRPMLYGTEDIKHLERIIMRGVLYNLDTPIEGEKPVIMISQSNDNVNYKIVKGLLPDKGSYKDLDLGLLSRCKHRQFIFSFAGQMDENSYISKIETEINKEYNNSKMR